MLSFAPRAVLDPGASMALGQVLRPCVAYRPSVLGFPHSSSRSQLTQQQQTRYCDSPIRLLNTEKE